MTRRYEISQDEVRIAWEAVCRAGGSSGYDGKTIDDVKANQDNELYKLWNRLSSGSYMAQPVQQIQIPKVSGGMRTLGIPTVTDRLAQMILKNRLEPLLEPYFHEDSYAYRPNRSAEQAVGVARERCFKYKWVLDIDIKGFFDTIEHDLLLEMLKAYTQDPMIHLYVGRFLKADAIDKEGHRSARNRGTAQGGVISPLLANLYLHEAFDKWMKTFPGIVFERYADDIIVHCVSENQAYYMKNRLKGRLTLYGLERHPDKTHVVYTGTDGNGGNRKTPRTFTYLGYQFKPRCWGMKRVFTPAIGVKAKTILRQKMKTWNLTSRLGQRFATLATVINPQIRGWITYYGHYRRSALYAVARDIDNLLVKWIKRKLKLRVGYIKAWNKLNKIKRAHPRLFCHWYMISTSCQ